MKYEINRYKDRLERYIGDYMARDISDRNASATASLLKCWEEVCKTSKEIGRKHNFSPEDAQEWAKKLKNADGTSGAHWTVEQTSAVGKTAGVVFGDITQQDFWITMNMMYSDYCAVGEKFAGGKLEFYAELAKAFLLDKDGPDAREKLGAYYAEIVCGG